MKKILLILLVLIIPFSFILFHDKGNEYLKPYIATYLKSKLEQNMEIEVQHLKIDFNYVELDAILNDLTKVKAFGNVSLFARTLDIDYTLKSDGFKTFNNKVDINGTVLGSFNNLQIQGEGETLKSHIDYALNLKNDVIHNIKININKADIASLLELTAQAPYAKGKVDIDIDIPTLKDINTKGKAKIVLHETTLNEKIFKTKLEVDLPEKTVITANIDAKVSADIFKLEGNINSNLASIKLSNTIYNLKNKELLTDYTLIVPKLSKLIFLTQKKLNGTLNVQGKLIAKKDAFNLQGNSKSLEGDINFNYNGKKLDAQLHAVQLAKVLELIGENPYARGKLIGHIKLDDIKKLKGNFELKTLNAQTINKTLKKEFEVDFRKTIPFTFNTKGDIATGTVKLDYSLDSKIFQYNSMNASYELKNKKLLSTYKLNIPKLSELTPIVGKKLQGKLTFNGTVNYDKTLFITGKSKDLGGEIDFNLVSNKLKAKINSISVEKLMYVLNYPQIFKALLIGDFNYNLATRQGTFTSKLNQAQLLSNQLTVLIKQLRGIDLTKERYNETSFNAILNKNIIDINFKAKSKKVLLEIPTGRINKLKNTINSKYIVNIENKDIAGKIQGNISKPNITIESSDFLKDKVIDVIKSNISEETLKDLGLDKIKLDNIKPEDIKDTVKNLLGDFFK